MQPLMMKNGTRLTIMPTSDFLCLMQWRETLMLLVARNIIVHQHCSWGDIHRAQLQSTYIWLVQVSTAASRPRMYKKSIGVTGVPGSLNGNGNGSSAEMGVCQKEGPYKNDTMPVFQDSIGRQE